MKTPLAILNLLHQGRKTLVSILGVALALLLVFMQLGFMGAVTVTATNVLKALDFDVILRSVEYVHLYEAGSLPRKYLQISRNTSGVQEVRPFWITIHNWRTLPVASRGVVSELAVGEQPMSPGVQLLPIAVMAFSVDQTVFRLSDINQQRERLRRPDRILIDKSTGAEYGAANGRRFDAKLDLKRATEIGNARFEIAGTFELGTGLAANGAVVASRQGMARIWPWDTSRYASVGLLKLAPGADKETTLQGLIDRLRAGGRYRQTDQRLPPDASGKVDWSMPAWFQRLFSFSAPPLQAGPVDILTREHAIAWEEQRWLWRTPIGLIFQLGVVLALFVGATIVYMILASDVANRMSEYATLLAMGYSRRYLAGIVMTQAIVLCVLGFVVAWVAAELLYRLTYQFSNIPLEMTSTRVFSVGLLGLLMCSLSGLLALRKLWKAEPASLF